MSNARKKLSATFASSVLLAASALVATPAPAQTSGGGGDGGIYCYCQYASHLGGCPDNLDASYYLYNCSDYCKYYIIGPPPPECGGGYYYQPVEHSAEESAEPAGR